MSKRQQILSECFYVEGSVMGIGVLFCIDTGASPTILSTKIYEMIPESKRPPLRLARRPFTADGTAMQCNGRADFQIKKLGNLELTVTLTVAPITDDVLLGADLMQGVMNPLTC